MVITMPQLGETVTEGTIVRWHKAVGDEIVEDDILFDVSTDKVDSEVPSPAAGILREILVPEGETVAVGTALAVVASSDVPVDEIPAAAAPRSEPEPSPEPSRLRINESATQGVGPGARVTRDDVARRLAARSRPLPRAEPVEAPAETQGQAVAAGADDDVEPFTAIRRRTAEHMVRSLGTAAHTLVVMEVDYTGVERTRLAARDAFRSEAGFGLTALPFIARAVIDAIADFPRVNASVGSDELVVHRRVNLGIAVDLEFEGLVVPVISDADQLRLGPLAHAIHQHATAARARTLRPDDVAGGTFTLTNAGAYGTLLTAPIISQPQVAIISTDGVTMRPVALPMTGDGSGYGIAVHPIGNLALSFDHRAFDGAYASAFLQRVVQILTTRDWAGELG
jgi:2-oxoglutarate dehydrogenase E2 component (dihydrolipoamide succinyltransferase)